MRRVTVWIALAVVMGIGASEAWAAAARGGRAAGRAPGGRAGGAAGGLERPAAGNLPGAAAGALPATKSAVGLTPGSGAAKLSGANPRISDMRASLGAGNLKSQATAYNLHNPAYQPFTPAWYAAHPNAWHVMYPHADVWAAATVAGVATWLAVPLAAGGGTSTVVVSEGTGAAPAAATAPPPADPAVEQAAAGKLAQAGGGEAPDAAQWMPLGVFGLKPATDGDANRAIQLAVSRDGMVRGSHFDLITEDVQNVQGSVDKTAMKVAWKIGSKSTVVFQAPLSELTKPQGAVTVYYPDGKSAAWQLVQIGNAPAK